MMSTTCLAVLVRELIKMTKITYNGKQYYSTYEPEDLISHIKDSIDSIVITAEVKTKKGEIVKLEKSDYIELPPFRVGDLR